MLAPTYVRLRKSVRSSIGARWWRSSTTNDVEGDGRQANDPTIRGDPQPYVFASISP